MTPKKGMQIDLIPFVVSTMSQFKLHAVYPRFTRHDVGGEILLFYDFFFFSSFEVMFTQYFFQQLTNPPSINIK